MLEEIVRYRMLADFVPFIYYGTDDTLSSAEVATIDRWLTTMQQSHGKAGQFVVPHIVPDSEEEFALCELTGTLGTTVDVAIYA